MDNLLKQEWQKYNQQIDDYDWPQNLKLSYESWLEVMAMENIYTLTPNSVEFRQWLKDSVTYPTVGYVVSKRAVAGACVDIKEYATPYTGTDEYVKLRSTVYATLEEAQAAHLAIAKYNDPYLFSICRVINKE